MSAWDWFSLILYTAAAASLGALIATPIAYDRGRERATREAISDEATKWRNKRFAKVTEAKWPESGA